MSETNSPRKEGLLEEAAAWFARMRGPDADESREEFEKWLARGALHRAAYNRAAEVFAMGKVLAEDDRAEDPELLRPSRRHQPLFLAAMTSMFAIVLTSGLLLGHHQLVGSEVTDAGSSTATQVAELSASAAPQSIRLADNSRVQLARDSSIGVQFGAGERRLLLERGEARFFVAHEHRPFVVYAGGGYVVAHGTVFDVALSRDRRVNVRLIEGVVDVSAPLVANRTRPGRPVARLHPGETVSFVAAAQRRTGDTTASVQGSSSDLSTDEHARLHDYDSVPLADVVRLANAGASRPIRIADEDLARRRISGKFGIDDTDLLADRIAGLFDLIVDRSNPSEIVLRKK